MTTTTSFKNLIYKAFLSIMLFFATILTVDSQTVVERYGQLSVDGNRIVNSGNVPIQLRGMSLYWSHSRHQFYNYDCIKWLKYDWNISVIRAAMTVEGGYLNNPEREKERIEAVVDAAIDLGIYVVIDWHDHRADENEEEAIEFFSYMAEKYGDYPNIIYETWNEPLNIYWRSIIRPYHRNLVAAIRKHDENNIIVLGTRHYSQYVDEAAEHPVEGDNLAYVLHFYADTHGERYRNYAETALEVYNKPVFVSEYGTTDASGDGNVNEDKTRTWWDFMDEHMISHMNWSVSNVNESSAILLPGVNKTHGWDPETELSESGKLVREELRSTADYYEITTNAVNGSIAKHLDKADHKEGEPVKLTAVPENGYIFNEWIGDTDGTDNPTTIIINDNMSVTASFVEGEKRQLTVEDGSGSGEYTHGVWVEIEADPAPDGQQFHEWTGDTDGIQDINSSSTILAMPDSEATVTANYKDIQSEYNLSVISGEGDGQYAPGEEVTIIANEAGTGKIFAEWAGDVDSITDIYSSTTTIIMPASNTTIIATYDDYTPTSVTTNNENIETIPEHKDSSASLKLYPNPAKKHVKITTKTTYENAVVKIINLNGTVIFRDVMENSRELLINTSSLAKGVYIIKLNSNDELLYEKLIIN